MNEEEERSFVTVMALQQEAIAALLRNLGELTKQLFAIRQRLDLFQHNIGRLQNSLDNNHLEIVKLSDAKNFRNVPKKCISRVNDSQKLGARTNKVNKKHKPSRTH